MQCILLAFGKRPTRMVGYSSTNMHPYGPLFYRQSWPCRNWREGKGGRSRLASMWLMMRFWVAQERPPRRRIQDGLTPGHEGNGQELTIHSQGFSEAICRKACFFW